MKTVVRFVLLAVLAPAAYSQSVLYTFDGDPGDLLGLSVSGAGDVNADGFDDMIAGAPSGGYARVFSGQDGSTLYTFSGAGGFFGNSVSGAGDVNADGFADVIVGAPYDTYVRVFSGVDGSVLFNFDVNTGEFGWSVSGAGDVNGDGFDDLIVGAPYDDNNGTDSGSARIFSGADGSVLYIVDGESAGDLFGYSVSGAGDVDGDGFDDVVVGAWRDDKNGSDTGSASVISGADGSILYTFDGGSLGDRFGYAVSGGGDVNADGFADVIVGAYRDDSNGFDTGRVFVFSGADGAVLHTFDGDTSNGAFGLAVGDAGDVNGDGFDDVVVGAVRDAHNGTDSGSAAVYSGADGSKLFFFDGEVPNEGFGISVGGAGDVNGDGLAEVIAGSAVADHNGANSGVARVFSSCNSVGTNYCVATPNSSGFPASIAGLGSDVIADNDVMLITTDVAANHWGYYLMSEAQAFVPGFGGSQGNLCLGPPIFRFSKDVDFSGAQGIITLQLDLTSLPQGTVFQPGETWNFQLWFRDVNPNFTSNTSDGLAITFQ